MIELVVYVRRGPQVTPVRKTWVRAEGAWLCTRVTELAWSELNFRT